MRRASEEGDIEAAERVARAELVQYLDYVYRHTVPMCEGRAEDPTLDTFVRVDLNALEEVAWYVIQCMVRKGGAESPFDFIDRLCRSVPLAGFETRASYLKGLTHMMLNNETEAKEIARDLGDPTATNHPPIVEFCLDMLGGELGVAARLDLAKWIRESTEDPGTKLQYTCLRAMLLGMHGDKERALAELGEALAAAESANKDRLDVRALWKLADAYGLQWKMTDREEDFKLAVAHYENVPSADLNAAGKAELRLQLGWLQLLHGDLERAEQVLLESLELELNDGAVLRLAEVHLAQQKTDKALEVLAMAKEDRPAEFELEYLLLRGAIAVRMSDTAEAESLVAELRKYEDSELYFRQQRDEACVALLQFVQDPGKARLGLADKILQKIHGLWDHIELKPGALGVSVDLKGLFARKGGKDHSGRE